LCIDREQLGDGIFEGAPSLHGGAYGVHPVGGDGLHTFLPVDHKREQAEGMASALSAMTVGLAAAPMGKDKRAWQSVSGDAKLSQQVAFSALQARGIGP